MFVGSLGPRFNEQQLREAVAASFNWTEVLRRLGYCPTGNNPKTVKKYVAQWSIDTSHFNPDLARHRGLKGDPKPLDEILVENSTFSRGHLKRRLYEEGLKERACELCGQGEMWCGMRISLILDHINGVRDDNRLQNLRIVCPNCAATLETHCGKGLRKPRAERACERCGAAYYPKHRQQRYCSRECGQRAAAPKRRRVSRPPYEQLLEEIERTSYSAVGRKYGVSDRAIRKWVRAYEREVAEDGKTGPEEDPPPPP